MYKNRHQTRDILLIKKGTIVKINTFKSMKLCASTAIDLELLSYMAVKLWIKSVTTYKESCCRMRGVQALQNLSRP
jgi:hypothetical protein